MAAKRLLGRRCTSVQWGKSGPGRGGYPGDPRGVARAAGRVDRPPARPHRSDRPRDRRGGDHDARQERARPPARGEARPPRPGAARARPVPGRPAGARLRLRRRGRQGPAVPPRPDQQRDRRGARLARELAPVPRPALRVRAAVRAHGRRGHPVRPRRRLARRHLPDDVPRRPHRGRAGRHGGPRAAPLGRRGQPGVARPDGVRRGEAGRRRRRHPRHRPAAERRRDPQPRRGRDGARRPLLARALEGAGRDAPRGRPPAETARR